MPARPTLTRVPSTREDVFSTTAIPARAKRSLMKFLKFVLGVQRRRRADVRQNSHSLPITEQWSTSRLRSVYNQSSNRIRNSRHTSSALTLSLDGQNKNTDGLAAIRRHWTPRVSSGLALPPSTPNGADCRRSLRVDAGPVQSEAASTCWGPTLSSWSNDDEKERKLRAGAHQRRDGEEQASHAGRPNSMRPAPSAGLVAVVSSPLRSLFATVVEGAPIPAVTSCRFPCRIGRVGC